MNESKVPSSDPTTVLVRSKVLILLQGSQWHSSWKLRKHTNTIIWQRLPLIMTQSWPCGRQITDQKYQQYGNFLLLYKLCSVLIKNFPILIFSSLILVGYLFVSVFVYLFIYLFIYSLLSIFIQVKNGLMMYNIKYHNKYCYQCIFSGMVWQTR